jgi:hypothetical protein
MQRTAAAATFGLKSAKNAAHRCRIVVEAQLGSGAIMAAQLPIAAALASKHALAGAEAGADPAAWSAIVEVGAPDPRTWRGTTFVGLAGGAAGAGSGGGGGAVCDVAGVAGAAVSR